MVVVHYRTDDLRPRLEACVPTDESGANDVEFAFVCECGFHPYTHMEDITTLQGHLFSLSIVLCLASTR